MRRRRLYVCGISVCTYAERDRRKEVHTESVVALSNSEGQTVGGTRGRAGRVGVTKSVVPLPLSLKNRYDVQSADHVGRVVCYSLDLSMYLFLSKSGPCIPLFGYCLKKYILEYQVPTSESA